MSVDDKWAEAYSRLQSAVEIAREAGLTDEEIDQCVEETRPSSEPYKPGKPKPSRQKGKFE